MGERPLIFSGHNPSNFGGGDCGKLHLLFNKSLILKNLVKVRDVEIHVEK